MRQLIKYFLLTSLLVLSNCAHSIEGSTNNIAVEAGSQANTRCKLTNSRGTVETVAPATVMVKKSISDLEIACSDNVGSTGKLTVASDVEPWVFGNILAGGLIGLGVDWGTGAAYTYPEKVVIPMSNTYGYYAPATPGTLAPQPYAGSPVSYVGQPPQQNAYAPLPQNVYGQQPVPFQPASGAK